MSFLPRTPKFSSSKLSYTRGSRVKGNAYTTVEVTGVDAVRSMLRPLLEPEITQHLDASNKKAAQSLAKDLRREVRPLSRHMQKAVRVKRAKTGKPGWVVGSRRKVAFFWPFVIGGTKDHGPKRANSLLFVPGWNPYLGASSHGVGNKWVRAKRVRGVKANNAVERVADRRGNQAMNEAARQFIKDTKL